MTSGIWDREFLKDIADAKNKLCIVFPTRLCWQIREPTLGADKPCDAPCINNLAYQKFKKEGLMIPTVLPITVLFEKLGEAEK